MSVEQLILNVNKDQGQPSYEKRIDALKNKRFQVDHIERGINEAVDKLQSKVRSFVIYGEPQSGKTEFMIALTCKLFDLNYKTIFVVMNDNTELETQNFDRFHNSIELNPTPMRDFQINQLATDELKVDKQRIIFCRKNSKNLQKLIESCRHMTGRVVIDDEADYATPNTKINKAELTAINDYLGKLGELEEDGEGIYIGVTATPARLDLNNTYLNKSKSWVFLDSHNSYKGRSFFFPVTNDEKSSSDFTLKLLPDEGDDPKLLQEAVFRFINTVALLNLQNKENKAYSMLIHTAGKTNDHEKDQQDVQKIIRILSNQNDKKFKALAEKLLNTAKEISAKYKSEFTGLDLAKYVLNNLGKQEVLVINHKNDSANVKRACEPKSIFTFAIGGNIVSRGLTFDSLLLFFFSRNVKGKLQQNTYIQRARMFGTRRYSAYFELCVPKSLFRDWAECFQDHELSLLTAKAGMYQHVQGKSSSVVDTGAIDKANVTTEKMERTVGEIFSLSKEASERITTADQEAPLTCIKQLIKEGLIPKESFSKEVMFYLMKTTNDEENQIYMVLRKKGDERLMQNIERYKDANSTLITRKKGGIIHAMLNKLPEYKKYKHFILPVRNKDSKARFYLKTNLGHSILINKKNA